MYGNGNSSFTEVVHDYYGNVITMSTTAVDQRSVTIVTSGSRPSAIKTRKR